MIASKQSERLVNRHTRHARPQANIAANWARHAPASGGSALLILRASNAVALALGGLLLHLVGVGGVVSMVCSAPTT